MSRHATSVPKNHRFFNAIPHPVWMLAIVLACFSSGTVSSQPFPSPWTDAALEQRIDAYLNMRDREAARAELDAILSAVETANAPTTYVRAWTTQAVSIAQDGDVEGAIQVIQDLMEYAERHAYPDVWVEVLANKVALLTWQGETARALVVAEQLSEYLEDAVDHRVRYYGNVVVTGLFRSNSQYERALSHALAAQEALSHTNNERTATRRISLQQQITFIYSDLRNYPAALEVSERALREALENDYLGLAASLLLARGYLFSQMDQHEDAIEVHRQAIDLAEQAGEIGIVLVSRNNIGSAYIHLERYEEAHTELTEALALAKEVGDEETADLLRYNLGYIQVMQGDIEAGIAEVEFYATRLQARYSAAEYAELLEHTATLYEHAGMYQEQAQALLEQRRLREEVFQAEREKSISEMQVRFEAREQAQQIELLEQRNALQERVIENAALQRQIFILFGVVVVFGLIIMIMLYRMARRANLRLKVVNKQLEFHSMRDPLTHLLNRRALQEQMQKRNPAEKADRRVKLGEHPDALILLDIDFFKRINDNFGHAAGDEVLKELSQRLQGLARSSDLVVRWGGEEFLIVLRNSDSKVLPSIVSRILDAIAEQPVHFEGRAIPVTATAGFVTLPFAGVPEEEVNWERALQIADMALYIGKVHGRNQAYGIMGLKVPFEQVQPLLETDLAKAIEEDMVEYTVLHGPKVN
ncbi:diguanylate cyclase [Aliidiomarina sanyensis]|uniref:diguanylate cyclase n=1 Tax=Aliidiomarina sanyensis TaxID=1249555 RepID=A0A432WK39_9GAMM|nr:diguanylate cyclase [Aliidiomarina sanyensis]RUO34170.1 GGDEF domain-containing protein [Aliidiomarina sanyensis]